jgi:hypothetical protein
MVWGYILYHINCSMACIFEQILRFMFISWVLSQSVQRLRHLKYCSLKVIGSLVILNGFWSQLISLSHFIEDGSLANDRNMFHCHRLRIKHLLYL